MLALTKDSWLTSLLDKEVYRGTKTLDTSSPSDSSTANIPPRSFIYTKLATTDRRTVQALENGGFRIAEVALTFETDQFSVSAGSKPPHCIRRAKPEDRDDVVSIARVAFYNSRFHTDEELRPYAELVKGEWAGNYFSGLRGDDMLVAEVDGHVAGFLLLLEPKPALTVIDLIAVDENQRGLGLAKALILSARESYGPRVTFRVGTQVHNIPSVRLYESLGFRLIESSFVLHHHRA